ncbi:CRISPR-associated endoribonuclease Cas6 [Sphingobacterium multivorum]|uniref:CRISPR-associated endoribonuclease Cas6 n=1 Tax=Sphingobacterium multivorum TaxID=28454 RepID=UPI0028AD185B|nr:CRISPR-associated endoribonuclease Cas6 [Sphingobacterium multivorum]
MQFKITLKAIERNSIIPINYQYPISAALYKIIAKGDEQYAEFLHGTGYGRGFKFFTFSDINCPFEIKGDRVQLIKDEIFLYVCFHIPETMESFLKGLFASEKIDIADKKSKASFQVLSVESIPNPLLDYKENEIVSKLLKPLSPIVAGIPNERGYDDYLSPDDPRFIENLIYNWRSKIADCYDGETADGALLMMEVKEVTDRKRSNVSKKQQEGRTETKGSIRPKSRLVTIKADTKEETKIRGWINFGLKVIAERRFVELLLNGGIGLYNAQGMGALAMEESR